MPDAPHAAPDAVHVDAVSLIEPRHPRRRWHVQRGVAFLGTGSSIAYALAVGLMTIEAAMLGPVFMSWISEWWGVIGGSYVVLQILPIITRPLTAEAQEMADNITSYIPSAVVFLVIPVAFLVQGDWPLYWAWKIWMTSLPFAVCDLLLTQVSYMISRGAQRVTSQ